jgi:glucosamine-6-phosphate deaminase
MIQELKAGKLTVKIYENRHLMGISAAKEAASYIIEQLNIKEELNIVFAAAPSQNDFLAGLIKTDGIQWNRINAFHMDEYIGLPEDAPQGFGNFLKAAIFSKLPFLSVNYINGRNPDPIISCNNYMQLLLGNLIDIVFMGIGENGHIAFNDPHVALFNDLEIVKVVDLDEVCRTQQVNDGCFSSLDQVPTHALTLTIPALLSGERIFCIVPSKKKAKAVKSTVLDRISERCPASILRMHEAATLYCDKDSAELLLY